MGTVKSGFKLSISEAVASVLTILILAAPFLLAIYAGLWEPTSLQGVANDFESFVVDGNMAVIGGAFIGIFLATILLNLYLLGKVSQLLWGWDEGHSPFRTGFKFTLLTFPIWIGRKTVSGLLETAFDTTYSSLDAFIAALKAGSTEAYLFLGASVAISVGAFLALGWIANHIGWK